MGPQKRAMAARLVGAAAEQGDSSLGGAASYLRDRRLRLGPLETGEIARDVLLPRDGLVEVRAQQLGHRAQLLEPHAHALLADAARPRSEEHTSELQSQSNLVCRLLLEKKKKINDNDKGQSERQ